MIYIKIKTTSAFAKSTDLVFRTKRKELKDLVINFKIMYYFVEEHVVCLTTAFQSDVDSNPVSLLHANPPPPASQG